MSWYEASCHRCQAVNSLRLRAGRFECSDQAACERVCEDNRFRRTATRPSWNPLFDQGQLWGGRV